jgi:hypothetical protein
MIRLSVLFSLSGLALSAIPIDFPSPLTIDELGRFVSTSNVFVAGSTQGVQLPLRLTSGPLVVVGADVSNSASPAEIAFNMVNNPHRVYPLRLSHVRYHGTGSGSYLGIGTDSRLLGQSGSLAVIRRNDTSAELIISSTRDYFSASCRPGTLMTVDASSELRQAEVQVKLWNGTLSTTFGAHRLEFGGRTVFPKRALIPEALYENIRESIISNGFVAGMMPWNFSECSSETIATLPTIDFRFETGSIVLFPDAYMDFNAIDRTCRLQLSIAPAGGPVVLDPLRLVGLNVRVTRDNVWDFCDSDAEL